VCADLPRRPAQQPGLRTEPLIAGVAGPPASRSGRRPGVANVAIHATRSAVCRTSWLLLGGERPARAWTASKTWPYTSGRAPLASFRVRLTGQGPAGGGYGQVRRTAVPRGGGVASHGRECQPSARAAADPVGSCRGTARSDDPPPAACRRVSPHGRTGRPTRCREREGVILRRPTARAVRGMRGPLGGGGREAGAGRWARRRTRCIARYRSRLAGYRSEGRTAPRNCARRWMGAPLLPADNRARCQSPVVAGTTRGPAP
jgi:hypothetical protein